MLVFEPVHDPAPHPAGALPTPGLDWRASGHGAGGISPLAWDFPATIGQPMRSELWLQEHSAKHFQFASTVFFYWLPLALERVASCACL